VGFKLILLRESEMHVSLILLTLSTSCLGVEYWWGSFGIMGATNRRYNGIPDFSFVPSRKHAVLRKRDGSRWIWLASESGTHTHSVDPPGGQTNGGSIGGCNGGWGGTLVDSTWYAYCLRDFVNCKTTMDGIVANVTNGLSCPSEVVGIYEMVPVNEIPVPKFCLPTHFNFHLIYDNPDSQLSLTYDFTNEVSIGPSVNTWFNRRTKSPVFTVKSHNVTKWRGLRIPHLRSNKTIIEGIGEIPVLNVSSLDVPAINGLYYPRCLCDGLPMFDLNLKPRQFKCRGYITDRAVAWEFEWTGTPGAFTWFPTSSPTSSPTTQSPTTQSPTTPSPTTLSPTTLSPTTASPTTAPTNGPPSWDAGVVSLGILGGIICIALSLAVIRVIRRKRFNSFGFKKMLAGEELADMSDSNMNNTWTSSSTIASAGCVLENGTGDSGSQQKTNEIARSTEGSDFTSLAESQKIHKTGLHNYDLFYQTWSQYHPSSVNLCGEFWETLSAQQKADPDRYSRLIALATPVPASFPPSPSFSTSSDHTVGALDQLRQISYKELKFDTKFPLPTKGSQGYVRKASFRGIEVAVKFPGVDDMLGSNAEKSEEVRQEAKNFSQCWAQGYNPNVLNVIGISVSPGGKVLLVLPWLGRSLRDELMDTKSRVPLTPRRQLDLALGCAKALEGLHSKGLVHCDVAARNFLVEDKFFDGNVVPHVVICDLGFAHQEGAKFSARLLSGVIAPELQTNSDSFTGVVQTRCDIYSFALLLLEILLRKPNMTSYDVNARLTIDEPIPKETPLGIKLLIESCRKKNSDERPESMAVVRHKLEAFIDMSDRKSEL